MKEDKSCKNCKELQPDGRCLMLDYFLECHGDSGVLTGDVHVIAPYKFSCCYWDEDDKKTK